MARFNLSQPLSSPVSRTNSLRKPASETRTRHDRSCATPPGAPSITPVEPDKVTLREGLQGLVNLSTEASVEEVSGQFNRKPPTATASTPSGAMQTLIDEILSFNSDSLDTAMSQAAADFAPAFLHSLATEHMVHSAPIYGRIVEIE